jgi:hypothetical protein
MHGFNQGFSAMIDLIDSVSPDIFLVQEHWLTPDNLGKFNDYLPDYYGFGISAMVARVEAGPLFGRPFGGALILIKNSLLSICECILASERFVIVKVGNIIVINVYLPCTGTIDRELICDDILAEISSWKSKYSSCGCLIGGDFNVDLDSHCSVATNINKFIVDNNFSRCDLLYPSALKYTYINEALNHSSKIDFILVDDVNVKSFDILEPNVNLSDHLPLLAVCGLNVKVVDSVASKSKCEKETVAQLRWDHADIIGYFNETRLYLQSILTDMVNFESGYDIPQFNAEHFIDSVYGKIICALDSTAGKFVPKHRVNF